MGAVRRDTRIPVFGSGVVAGTDKQNEDVARKIGDEQGMRTRGKECERSDEAVNASLLFTQRNPVVVA